MVYKVLEDHLALLVVMVYKDLVAVLATLALLVVKALPAAPVMMEAEANLDTQVAKALLVAKAFRAYKVYKVSEAILVAVETMGP